MEPAMRRAIAWRRRSRLALLGVFGLLGLLTHAAALAQAQQRVLRAQAAWPIDSFTLIDQHGQPFTQDRLMGRWTFVLFGDTACAAPCTHALATLDGVFRRIERAEVHKVTQVLFVCLDQPVDRPDRLREVLAPYDKRFVAGTGPRVTVERLIDDWRVGKDEAAPSASPGAASANAGSLLLVSPDGTVRAEYLPPFDVAWLTADYLKTRARGGRP